jgi:hypothetical protein
MTSSYGALFGVYKDLYNKVSRHLQVWAGLPAPHEMQLRNVESTWNWVWLAQQGPDRIWKLVARTNPCLELSVLSKIPLHNPATIHTSTLEAHHVFWRDTRKALMNFHPSTSGQALSFLAQVQTTNRDKQASTLRKQSGKSEETLSHTCCCM